MQRNFPFLIQLLRIMCHGADGYSGDRGKLHFWIFLQLCSPCPRGRWVWPCDFLWPMGHSQAMFLWAPWALRYSVCLLGVLGLMGKDLQSKDANEPTKTKACF